VIPLAVAFLWLRRDRFPRQLSVSWWGLLLILASIAVRLAGAHYALTPCDGWSMILWLMGAAWCLGGWQLARWALPAVLFLLFMIPLPYRLEFVLSIPLQSIAAGLSAFILQSLGQPGFAEGTTILLGDHVLEVERSCSGLRIFVGIFALACAYLIARRCEVWESAVLLVSVVPVALLANATRIVVTGWLYQHVSGEAAQRFSHDVAGWLMIPLAALLLALVQWYLQRLVRDVPAVEVGELLRRHRASA
jgi:exosortase